MDIVRFTAGASAEALAGNTDGDRVVELGAAPVAKLPAEPVPRLRQRREPGHVAEQHRADPPLRHRRPVQAADRRKRRR